MGSRREDMGPLSQYNSLTDPNLQGYYSKTIIRNQLRSSGLINRKGEIIPDEVWKKRILTKEKMQQASRLIANKIVQQAIEIKNLERAEIKKKLEEVSKKELVRRMRGQSAQNRQLPLLWGNNLDRPYSDTRRRNDSRSMSPKNDDYGDIRVVEDSDDVHRRSLVGKPPKMKVTQKNRYKRRRNKSQGMNSRFRSVYQPKPEYDPTMVTMIYYGKGINIPYDTQVFDSKDEISILQQHCGGENLCVFSGFLEAGDKFTWKSKRHKEFPFSVSIYINGTYDCRISTCCEYRHSLNVRIGGKTGRFGITNVTGGQPCVKCLLERANNLKKKEDQPVEIEKEEEIVVITDKPSEFQSSSTKDEPEVVPVKHGTNPNLKTYNSDSEDGFEDETKKCNWKVLVYTKSKESSKLLADQDASIRLKIIGKNESSDVITLDNMDEDNFTNGSTEKFNIVTSNIGEPTHVILNFKDTELRYKWLLQKIELVDTKKSKTYTFKFNNEVVPNKSIKIPLDSGSAANNGNSEGTKSWLIRVHTSDLTGKKMEGTDAKVYISLIEKNKESEIVVLDKSKATKNTKSDIFEAGNVDEFLIKTTKNIRLLDKIRIGHDNSGFGSGWHLKKVEIIDQIDGSSYSFKCNKWLSKDEDDGKIERILTKDDHLKSSSRTSISSFQDTDERSNSRQVKSPVSDKFKHKSKVVDKRKSSIESVSSSIKPINPTQLPKSKRLSVDDVVNEIKQNDSFVDSSKNDFNTDSDTSSSDTSSSDTTSYVEKSDAKKKSESRLSSRQSVLSNNSAQNKNLKLASVNNANNKISSSSSSRKSSIQSQKDSGEWLVKIYTSDLDGTSMEGTDSNVYIALIGSNLEAEKVRLTKQIAKSKNKDLFEAGQCDEFTIYAPTVKKLKKIRIGIDNSGFGAGWHLHKVEVIDQKDGTKYLFECDRWLSKDEDDGKIERILYANEEDSSSDSSDTSLVSNDKKSKSSTIVGSNPNSNRSSHNNSPSKQKSTRLSGLEVSNILNKDVSPKNSIDDNDNVSVNSDNSYMKKVKSPVKPALTNNSQNKLNESKSAPSSKNWTIKVYTSDLNGKKMEGTDANVYISLIGPKLNETGNIMLDKKVVISKNKDLFEEGQCDEFLVTTTPNMKKLKKIRIGHDNSGFGAGWHLNKVEIIDQTNNKQYVFMCERWLAKNEDDGKIERILTRKPSENDDSSSSSDSTSSSNSTRKSNKVLTPISKVPKDNHNQSGKNEHEPKPLTKQSSKQSSLFQDSDDTDNFSDDSENSLFVSKKGENTTSQQSIKNNSETNITNKANKRVDSPTNHSLNNSSTQSLRKKLLAEKKQSNEISTEKSTAKEMVIPKVNVIPNTPSQDYIESRENKSNDSLDSSNGMNNWYKEEDLKNIT